MEIVISGFKNFAFFQLVENRGGYKIFSKGGGGQFIKIFRKLCRPFLAD